MDQILILLASYNGSKYVPEMIESILQQSYTEWHLVLSDDQSTDGTDEILEAYAQKYPDVITHYCSHQHFGNAEGHFMHLLQKFHDAPYIMFCDQDDVWHPDKITKTIGIMKEIEVQNVPAMVHTDLCVVDQNLKQISPSFTRYSSLDGHRLKLNNLLMQNVVTGCTMMINRALAVKGIENIPDHGMLMHDWWLALIAAAYGTTAYLDEPTIDYRQHGDNVVGAKNTKSPLYILNKISSGNIHQLIMKTVDQAKALYDCYGTDMPEPSGEIVKSYVDLKTSGFWKRRASYIKNKFYKCGFIRIVSQMIWG